MLSGLPGHLHFCLRRRNLVGKKFKYGMTPFLTVILFHVSSRYSSSRSWSSLFKPRPWRETKLPSTASFTKGKFHAIIRSMPWIQSSKVAAVHVHKISHVDFFSQPQDRALYDDNYGPQAYDGAPVNVDTILALIERNNEMKRLEIDLNR